MTDRWFWEKPDAARSGAAGDLAKLFKNEQIEQPGVLSKGAPNVQATVLAREVRGKVLSFRETDFILAAKEMGASDARVIFRHLYPHTLSHVIVVLTLQIPQIILAEAFLSFLGLGIQEPLISWGYLMRDSNSLETLGVNPWILSPAAFIVIAVLGFNFLGDGLRDAADPYAIA